MLDNYRLMSRKPVAEVVEDGLPPRWMRDARAGSADFELLLKAPGILKSNCHTADLG